MWQLPISLNHLNNIHLKNPNIVYTCSCIQLGLILLKVTDYCTTSRVYLTIFMNEEINHILCLTAAETFKQSSFPFVKQQIFFAGFMVFQWFLNHFCFYCSFCCIIQWWTVLSPIWPAIDFSLAFLHFSI